MAIVWSLHPTFSVISVGQNNLLTPSDLVFPGPKMPDNHHFPWWCFMGFSIYIYISEVTLGKVVRFPSNLVGGIPTPLKNDGVRQLGRWHSQLNGKSSKIHVPKHQPDLSLNYCYGYPKTKIHLFSKIDLVIMLDPNGGAPCCFVKPNFSDSHENRLWLFHQPCCHLGEGAQFKGTVDGCELRWLPPINRWLKPKQNKGINRFFTTYQQIKPNEWPIIMLKALKLINHRSTAGTTCFPINRTQQKTLQDFTNKQLIWPPQHIAVLYSAHSVGGPPISSECVKPRIFSKNAHGQGLNHQTFVGLVYIRAFLRENIALPQIRGFLQIISYDSWKHVHWTETLLPSGNLI